MLTVSKNYETTKHAVPVQETGPIQSSEIYIFCSVRKTVPKYITYDIWMAYNRFQCLFQKQTAAGM